ncbi:MAG: hypothetical protein JWM82_4476 [Myxococcales bacterium]|nr:hypothetical protein [Myxococcales bacterium]
MKPFLTLLVAVTLGACGSKAQSPATDGGAGATGTKPDANPNAMLPPATGTPGVWENVTSAEMPAELFTNGFGVGNIRTDPARPSDLYVGGYGSIWKSTDYGKTWARLDSQPNPPSLALGHVLAVAGTTPATLWMANVNGDKKVFNSTDGGLTFTLTGTLSEKVDVSLYSIVVDPNDSTHLLSGFHEADKLAESTDGGETWRVFTGAGWPPGGISWFVFFVDTGAPATTRKTWLAIAQNGGSAVMTTDGGATWTKPTGLQGLQHPHGCSQLFQSGGNTLFLAGTQGPQGDGVYRSLDLGKTWTRVAQGSGAIAFGSSKNVYAMWGWACAGCKGGPQLQVAAQPGDTWTKPTVPDALTWGPNSVAVTSDGVHSIFVGSMWATGLWRYVEP